MVERQDIDALLVGALYGELTPADEARLSAHLESHPGDRSALDGLKTARRAVRESRIFDSQLDPPQAVSALLLQEAARRAPRLVVHEDHDQRDGEGWFARFVRSFSARPAMAAAAMFVVVIGAAGTMYLKNGNQQQQVAEQRVADPDVAPAAFASAPTSTAAMGSAASSPATTTANPTYHVSLDDGDQLQSNVGGERGKNSRGDGAKPIKPAPAPQPSDNLAKKESQEGQYKGGDKASELAKHKSIDVRTADRKPMEMPDPQSEVADLGATRDAPAPAAPIGGYVTTGAAATAQRLRPPPPPPSQAPQTPKVEAKNDGKDDGKNDEAFQWAQSEHQLLIAAVKGGKCQDAGKIAVGIRNRAPDYYNSYVASDRSLKSCMQYITDAADKDAERSAKSRPAKRADMNEVK